MKLGLLSGYSGKVIDLRIDLIKHAEALGYESVWTAEAYGSDAVTTAAWILANTETIKVGTAIMQMPARSPACTAMTAMTLNQLSNGRFIIGLGASGPQVIEGWHGLAYGRPITRTREYIEIIRKIMAREGPVEYQGYHYQLPYARSDGTGLGKPLKSILKADTSIRIYTASITNKGMETSAELADGVFPVWMNPDRYDVFEAAIDTGLKKGNKTLDDFDIAPFVTCIMGDDIDKCRLPVKAAMALYIGGMGAKDKNFYKDYTKALAYEEAAETIQDLYLAGKKDEAVQSVPDDLVDQVALVGDKSRIIERLQAWQEAGLKKHVGTMLINSRQPEAIELIANEIL